VEGIGFNFAPLNKSTPMSTTNDTLAKPENYRLEFAQIGWVVPDIRATVKFMEKSLGVSFP
jgi:methylmalonyl-CoA/ethylmalonyl-CoA epimerase